VGKLLGLIGTHHWILFILAIHLILMISFHNGIIAVLLVILVYVFMHFVYLLLIKAASYLHLLTDLLVMVDLVDLVMGLSTQVVKLMLYVVMDRDILLLIFKL